MINKIKTLLNINKVLEETNNKIEILKRGFEENNLMLGKLLLARNLEKSNLIKENIHLAEFKVFSQWGDDGIINFLINYLEIDCKRFIEFGVENYTECNTKFLLINSNWEGLIIDGSKENMDSVRSSNLYWRYNLKAINQFVTAENINSLFVRNGFEGEIGLLHIDIDGNDYWIWKSINVVNPIIVIVEYNSVFGVENYWTTPYDPSFVRTNAHFSNLYYGVSISSICQLAEERGYSFIGCNSNGNNAYFVRNDKVKDLKVMLPKEGYVMSQFAESRDEKGNLTFLRGAERIKLLKGLPVYNTLKSKLETIE